MTRYTAAPMSRATHRPPARPSAAVLEQRLRDSRLARMSAAIDVLDLSIRLQQSEEARAELLRPKVPVHNSMGPLWKAGREHDAWQTHHESSRSVFDHDATTCPSCARHAATCPFHAQEGIPA